MAIKSCRKCHGTQLEPFFGTNGAPFLKCTNPACGHKMRTGMSVDILRRMIQDEVQKMPGNGNHPTAPSIPAPDTTPRPTTPSVDVEKAVKAAVHAQVAALRELAKPSVVEVHHDTGKIITIKGAHASLARLIKLLRAGFHVYLWGDAGTGKTTAALQAAEALKVDAEIDTLDPTTFRSMVQGYMTPKGEPVHTAFTRCWENGLAYVADETDNAPGHVQTLFNSALANGHAPLAWGNVPQHKKFLFIGTGNTPGRPTRQFPDRKPMSAAFADRLYFVHWTLDPAIEATAAGMPYNPTPIVADGPETVTPQQWVTFVTKLREWARTNCPTLMITPRASLVGLKALKLGERPMAVADALIFRGADDEIRSKAYAAVSLTGEVV